MEFPGMVPPKWWDNQRYLTSRCINLNSGFVEIFGDKIALRITRNFGSQNFKINLVLDDKYGEFSLNFSRIEFIFSLNPELERKVARAKKYIGGSLAAEEFRCENFYRKDDYVKIFDKEKEVEISIFVDSIIREKLIKFLKGGSFE